MIESNNKLENENRREHHKVSLHSNLKSADVNMLQHVELRLLDAFVEICESNHLCYYLNAGTLLGALRNQGFIPWDDDIDVCMPRSDYEKFLNVVESQLPPNMRAVYFRVQNTYEHPQYNCQILDLNTPLIQKISEKPRFTYAWIDVFPLDGMPRSAFLRKIHGWYLLYRRCMLQLPMVHENINIYKQRKIMERMLIWIAKKINFGGKQNVWIQMNKMDKALRKYPIEESKFLINFMGAYKLRETFSTLWYGTGRKLLFEGRWLFVPNKTEDILKILYGDYMTPKPPADIESIHRLYVINDP